MTITVAQAAKLYEADRRRRGVTPNTARSIRDSLRSLSMVAGDVLAAELSEDHIYEWLASGQGRIAPSSMRKHYVYVRLFCRWLHKERYSRIDATEEIAIPRKPRHVPRPVAEDDVAVVMATLPDERAELILSLVAQEGLRRMEVAGLQFADVDFAGRELHVIGKGGHERTVPITEETWDLMAAYLRLYPARSGPLIRSYKRPTKGLTPATVGHYVRQWSHAAGVPVTCHQYRHTAATAVLKGSGGNLRVTQDFLGHSSPGTTAIYTKVETSDLRAAMSGRRFRRSRAPSLAVVPGGDTLRRAA